MNVPARRFEELTGLSDFIKMLDLELLELSPGRMVCRVALAEKHSRSHGMAHGGLSASMLDTAMGLAARTLAPEGLNTVTAQLNIHYVRPALIGTKITATGVARHRGSRTAIMEGEIVDEDGRLIALATATMMFIPFPPASGAAEPPRT